MSTSTDIISTIRHLAWSRCILLKFEHTAWEMGYRWFPCNFHLFDKARRNFRDCYFCLKFSTQWIPNLHSFQFSRSHLRQIHIGVQLCWLRYLKIIGKCATRSSRSIYRFYTFADLWHTVLGQNKFRLRNSTSLLSIPSIFKPKKCSKNHVDI